MKIGVVIPCYRVGDLALKVISRIGPEVSSIFVVDDQCPVKTGQLVRANCSDPRVTVIFHEKNKGVGGAMVTGYRAAIEADCEIVIKIDGDNQMDPNLIPAFAQPIIDGVADYTKGNRFFLLESLQGMPFVRKLGNAGLSFMTKVSSGYWNVMDPTNGYTAIHSELLRIIPLDKLDQRYFFETDILFRLNTVRAVVTDVPMEAVYDDEPTSLKVHRVLLEFPGKHLVRVAKRIFYNYFLRDFNLCSLELIFGTLLTVFGLIFGAVRWFEFGMRGEPAPVGTVMLSALPVIIGFQLLLSAVTYDVVNLPRRSLHALLKSSRELRTKSRR